METPACAPTIVSSALSGIARGKQIGECIAAAMDRRQCARSGALSPSDTTASANRKAQSPYARPRAEGPPPGDLAERRAANEKYIVAFVRENPGIFSVEGAALRLPASPAPSVPSSGVAWSQCGTIGRGEPQPQPQHDPSSTSCSSVAELATVALVLVPGALGFVGSVFWIAAMMVMAIASGQIRAERRLSPKRRDPGDGRHRRHGDKRYLTSRSPARPKRWRDQRRESGRGQGDEGCGRASGPPGVLVAPASPDGNQHGEPVALLRKGA